MPDVPEEGVTQDYIVYTVHLWLIHDISVDKEEDWQVDFLACSDSLFFKAEALDFGKVWGDLWGQRLIGHSFPLGSLSLSYPDSIPVTYRLSSLTSQYPSLGHPEIRTPLFILHYTGQTNEFQTHLLRRHIIRRNPNQILIPIILSRIKRQRSLARQHTHTPLLRRE